MIWAVHRKQLKERYQIIANKLENAKSIFEPLCGPVLLPKFLLDKVEYSGFDINENFIRYAQKREYNVLEGDARKDTPYRNITADIVILVDAMHHIQPYEEQQRVVKRAANIARRKLIICEPFRGGYFKLFKKVPFLRKPFEWFFNWIERDGPNQSKFEHIQTKDSLEKTMKEGYGVLKGVKNEIQQVGPAELIVIYYL